jgi:hypothetical protein
MLNSTASIHLLADKPAHPPDAVPAKARAESTDPSPKASPAQTVSPQQGNVALQTLPPWIYQNKESSRWYLGFYDDGTVGRFYIPSEAPVRDTLSKAANSGQAKYVARGETVRFTIENIDYEGKLVDTYTLALSATDRKSGAIRNQNWINLDLYNFGIPGGLDGDIPGEHYVYEPIPSRSGLPKAH